MKVAVCLSGLLRTYQDCYQSLFDNVIIPNDADLFISTWNIMGTGTYKKQGTPWLKIPGEELPLDIDKAREVYKAKVFHVDEWQPIQDRLRRELEESCRKAPHHVAHTQINKDITHRIISMWYKIGDANRLRKEYEQANNIKYDVVIRARPDIKHNMMLKMSDFNTSWPHVYTDGPHSYGYVCDQFAFGSSRAIDLYSAVYPDILVYNNIIATYNAEAMLLYHLKKNGITWVSIDMKYKIVGPGHT